MDTPDTTNYHLYATDLTDEQWELIEPLLPVNMGAGDNVDLDLRMVANAIFYRTRTGCQWDMLPKTYPNHNSVYYHYAKWSRYGTLIYIQDALREQVRCQKKRGLTPSAAIIDSQSVKTTAVGGPKGYDAGKTTKGRKRHAIVDTEGLPMGFKITPADISDLEGGKALVKSIIAKFPRLKKIWGDTHYGGEFMKWAARTYDITVEVVKKMADQKGFVALPRRWVVERTLAWLSNYRILSKDYAQLLTSSLADVTLASIHILLRKLTIYKERNSATSSPDGIASIA